MTASTRAFCFYTFLSALTGASAFVPVSLQQSRATTTFLRESWPGVDFGGAGPSNGGKVGSLEQLEFKIYPDGRVEETVRGVKGGNCQEITEKINEQLGKVVASEPTEEMYEQEVVVDQTLVNSESNWDGSTPSSW